jgi:uncharacterized protein YprB with RNaseH-like and TPR domain
MRVVGWDLETTDLGGNFGRILCCSFKQILPPENKTKGKVYTFRADDPEFAGSSVVDDGKLAIAIRDELEHYDLLVGHNSLLYDRKFLNARLIKVGERILQPKWHFDTMWVVRTQFRMSSKLNNVQKMLGLPDEKTEINWDDWAKAGAYDTDAMDEVVHHCEQDVKVLEQAYWKLLHAKTRLERK